MSTGCLAWPKFLGRCEAGVRVNLSMILRFTCNLRGYCFSRCSAPVSIQSNCGASFHSYGDVRVVFGKRGYHVVTHSQGLCSEGDDENESSSLFLVLWYLSLCLVVNLRNSLFSTSEMKD